MNTIGMATHDFSTSLSYEQSKFSLQDKFYTEKLGAKAITRACFDNEQGKKLQRMDVDVQFVYEGRVVNVSEKNRKKDFGDLLLEFYSKFPSTPGWMNNSNADYLAYFVPGKVYWINKRELEVFYNDVLKPVVPDSFFAQLMSQNPKESKKVDRFVDINGRKEKITVAQAYNKPHDSDADWYTESICVSFSCLKQAGVHVNEFSL